MRKPKTIPIRLKMKQKILEIAPPQTIGDIARRLDDLSHGLPNHPAASQNFKEAASQIRAAMDSLASVGELKVNSR